MYFPTDKIFPQLYNNTRGHNLQINFNQIEEVDHLKQQMWMDIVQYKNELVF